MFENVGLFACYQTSRMSSWLYLYVLMVCRNRHKLRQPFADPHRHITVHVDSKWFIALLKATDSEVLQRTHIFAKVQPCHLADSHTADWNKT